MHKFLQIFVLVFYTFISSFCFAHDSNVATFQIRHLDGERWVYEVMSPLYGLDLSLRDSIQNETELNNLTTGSVEFKKKLVAHIKQYFDVKASTSSSGGKVIETMQLSLGKGKIKLDEHLSILIFEVVGMPKNFTQLDFRIANMSSNTSQINLFRLIDGERNKKYLLNHKNNFTGTDRSFFKLANKDSPY